MEDAKRHRETTRRKINKACLFLDLSALVILVVSLLSLPFPFVRQIWLESVVGAKGFVNCGLILFLTNRIRKFSYPAVLGGIGLAFHEQLLAARGFFTLQYHNAVDRHDILFFATTTLATLGLAALYVICLKPLSEYSKTFARDFYMESHRPVSQVAASFQITALIESLVVYAVLMLALWQSSILDLPLYFSACKLIGELTCITAFRGIGKEIDLRYKEAQKIGPMMIKIFSHILVLGGILWVIYKIMPVEPFLR